MEKLIELTKIKTYLQRLDDLLQISNRNGENSLTKICEGLMKDLFSIIYKAPLENTNLSLSNYPAIDLHSEEKRLAIQVTSNQSSSKIHTTFETFFKYKLDQHYKELKIIILTTKRFDLKLLQKKVNQISSQYNTSILIDISSSIITLPEIYNLIANTLDAEIITKILKLLENNFETSNTIENLTKYYESLKALFFQNVMDNDFGITLNGIYVDPNFSIHNSCANSECKELEYASYKSSAELNDKISIHEFLKHRLNNTNRFDQFFKESNSNVIFVMGYPGQGKTSLCSRLLFDLLTPFPNKPVFYLKLRNIVDTKTLIHNPFSCIFNELENLIDVPINKSLLKNSITILDGLDELYMKDNLNANDIEIFCKGVITESEKFKNWNVVITSRHGYINFDRMFRESFVAINIEPLDILQQQEWLAKYRSYNTITWLTSEKLKEINESKKRSVYIKELINQPLLLYIIASLEIEIDLSVNRTDIYNLLYDQIIDRKYSKDGQIENLKNLNKTQLKELLQEIAFAIFLNGRGYITEQEILNNEVFEEFLTLIGNERLSGTLKGILISFYFTERKLESSEGNKVGIEFFHKSLQEYLTAEKIVNSIFFKFLNKDSRNKYVLSKPEEMFKNIDEIFGKQRISFEIYEFISEMILEKEEVLKEELLKRLTLNLDLFFANDFLYNYTFHKLNPLKRMLWVFSTYWRFLHFLAPKQDFIKFDQEKTSKFFAFVSCAEILNDADLENLSISYQGFNDAYIPQINCVDTSITNSTIIESVVEKIHFSHTKINNIRFDNCTLPSLIVNKSKIDKMLFESCEIGELHFMGNNCKKNILFKDCYFAEEIFFRENKMNIITFEACSLTKTSFESVKLTKQNKNFVGCFVIDYQYDKRGNATHNKWLIDDTTLELIPV
jgi:uncharacterized protein YjbI with pentapeptide repeats